jgi:hypothetical protein
MADTVNVVGTRLQLYAEINEKQYDVVAYSSSFEINTIPSGSVLVPVGFDLATGVPADVMTRFDDFKIKQKIKIFLRVEADSANYGAGLESFVDPVTKKSAGPILIFEGEITGAILRRTAKSLHIAVHFVHWLSALNNSSVFSGVSHVINPVAFYNNGAAAYFTGSGVGAGSNADACAAENTAEGHWSVVNTAVEGFSGTEDIWENGLKPFLRCLIQQDSLNAEIQAYFNSDAAKQKRLDALDRVLSTEIILKDFADQAIIDNLATDIRQGVRSTDAGNTIWALLIGRWSPSYFFAICPRINDVKIAPLVGSYKDPNTPAKYKLINSSDYYSVDLNLSSRQSIGAVGVLAARTDSVMQSVLADAPPEWPGFYPPASNVPDDQKISGVFLTKEMPPWLANVNFERVEFDPTVPLPNAFGATPAAAVALAAQLAAASSSKAAAYQNVAQAFAQFFYVNEIFNNRSGEVSGKLRFDICPGSTVKLQAVPLDDTASSGFDYFYGQVIRVSYTIDASQGLASTVFSLSNLRTQVELDDTLLSIDLPPLYKKAWVGDTML